MSTKYPSLTPTERASMLKMGWLYNPREDIWIFAPGDVPFSTEQADHDKKFLSDWAKCKTRIAHADLNYATTGDAPYLTD